MPNNPAVPTEPMVDEFSRFAASLPSDVGGIVERIATRISERLADCLPDLFEDFPDEECEKLSVHFYEIAEEEAAATIRQLLADNAAFVERLEYAIGQFHNAQEWRTEDAPDGKGTLWDWVIATPTLSALKAGGE